MSFFFLFSTWLVVFDFSRKDVDMRTFLFINRLTDKIVLAFVLVQYIFSLFSYEKILYMYDLRKGFLKASY